MAIETINFAVGGGTPGADSNDYILFESATALTGTLAAHDITRIIFAVNSNQAGTLKAYFSVDKGANYTLYSSTAVAAYSSPAAAGPYDFAVDLYPDFKLVWTNGGSAQTTWRVSIRGVRNYHGAAS